MASTTAQLQPSATIRESIDCSSGASGVVNRPVVGKRGLAATTIGSAHEPRLPAGGIQKMCHEVGQAGLAIGPGHADDP